MRAHRRADSRADRPACPGRCRTAAAPGPTPDRVDIADTGSNAILLENCYNVTIAAEPGTVSGPGDIRIASRDEFPVSRDLTLRNLTINDSAINERPCGENITVRNNTFNNSSRNVC